jgi:hypothetical protein
MATYYIDTNDFSTATSIWTNSNLTIKAADGFYQKDGFYRQMSGGELLHSTICPSCLIPCGETIIANGAQGIYYLDVELEASTGAVIIEFNPDNVPDGILAVYNGTIYNGLSSPNYGWLQGTAGLPTYIGLDTATCSPTIVTNSPYTLDEFRYDGTSFVDLGTTELVTILSGQTQLTPSRPENTVMVIPKTLASPSDLRLTIIGPCTGTLFNISVSCPAALPSFDSSTMNATSELACSASITTTYYVAHVNGAGGTLGLYDLVFSDANGQSKLSAGYYKTNDAGTNEWYQVDANGVIIDLDVCTVPCGDDIEVDGGQGVYYIESNVGTDTGAIIVSFNPRSLTDGILATYNGVNYNGLSSPVWGWRQGTAGLPTYIGSTDCGIVANSPHNVARFEYNGTTFVPLGLPNIEVNVLAGQVQLNTSEPGLCIMVIPKPTATPSSLDISIIGLCSTTLFDIDINCTAPLTSFTSSLNNFDSSTACINDMDQNYYVAHVNGSGGTLGLYDLVFSDINGQFKLSAGYYKTNDAGANNWYRVDSNGAIIQFGTCP